MDDESIKISSQPLSEGEMDMLFKSVVEDGQDQNNEDRIRFMKLIQEGKIETVAQILSHRRAVAIVKKPD